MEGPSPFEFLCNARVEGNMPHTIPRNEPKEDIEEDNFELSVKFDDPEAEEFEPDFFPEDPYAGKIISKGFKNQPRSNQ